MKRILPFLLSLTFLLLAAPTAVKAQLTYTTNAGAITITGYSEPGGPVGLLSIPASTNGFPITDIAPEAFAYATNMTWVIVPDSVVNVESNAFEECTNLAYVMMTNGLALIGQEAFLDCSALERIDLPGSVTNIGKYAFFQCSNLASVTISNADASVGDYAFTYCTSLASATIPGNLTNAVAIFDGCTNLSSLTFTDGSTNIATAAFDYFASLVSVTIPASVAHIGTIAFYGCSNLATVTISNGAASLGDAAFEYCTRLASITIPGGLTNVGGAAAVLYGCANLTSVTISDGSTNVATDDFEDFTNLLSVTIPSSVINIGDYAFEQCGRLTRVTIDNGVTGLGMASFAYCINLATVAIPDSVLNIGDVAFENCTVLTNVNIGGGVTNIGAFAFAFCSSLGGITIPSNVVSIGTNAFAGCASLANLSIADGVTNIGPAAFAYCASLTDLTLPGSVTGIGSYAFEECTGLNSLTMLGGGTGARIGPEAFLGCSNLVNVVMDGSLTGIGTAAFFYCDKLTSVTIRGGVASIGEIAFQLCTNLNTLNIQGGVNSIGAQAFYGCSNLAGVAIGGGVGSIGEYAFLYCGKLTGVLFGGSAPNVSTNGPDLFYGDRLARVYRYYGAAGWTYAFADLPVNTVNQPSALLSVLINGTGSASPNDDGKVLTVGASYTITAMPVSKNSVFVNWTGGTNPGALTLLSTAPKFTFQMESNLALQANFMLTNLFFPAQGAYHGLFADTNEVPRQQSHSGSFTLNVTDSGSFTGDLYVGSASGVALTGKFNPNGTVTNVTKRIGKSTLTTTLTLDTNNQTVAGMVSDGSFVAQLSGDLAVFNYNNKAPYAGQYTLVIPGTTNATNGPFGTSYGTVTVASNGVITFAGSLADGTTVSQSSFISQDGAWPLYLPLYNGHGSIYSWNYFTQDVTNGTITLAANASWINATNSSATAAYKEGFTNNAAAIYGSAYTTNLLELPGGLGQVVLEGGGLELAPIITNYMALGSNDKITVTTNVNKMILTINKANGIISGTFANALKTVKVSGVLFQSQTNAQGFFLGNDQTSGSFTLMAQ